MREEIEAAYELEFPELLFMDGLDDAIIGVAERDSHPIVAYSIMKILESLVERGMDMHEAREYMDFNILGAYVGEYTPLIVDDLFY